MTSLGRTCRRQPERTCCCCCRQVFQHSIAAWILWPLAHRPEHAASFKRISLKSHVTLLFVFFFFSLNISFILFLAFFSFFLLLLLSFFLYPPPRSIRIVFLLPHSSVTSQRRFVKPGGLALYIQRRNSHHSFSKGLLLVGLVPFLLPLVHPLALCIYTPRRPVTLSS